MIIPHSTDQAETVSRRIEKFADLMQSIWVSRNDYERRVRAVSDKVSTKSMGESVTVSQLLAALKETQEKWASVKFTGTYADVKEHAANFATYKQTTKRAWVTEKQDLATLLGNVQTKLKTYKLRPYVPPPGLALSVRNNCGTSQIRAHTSIGHRPSVGDPFSLRSTTIEGDQRTDTRVRSS
jgi:hypothetical protein